MLHFEVDDDLAELVWRLAKPKPFEQLSFSAALRRILHEEGSVAMAVPPPAPPQSARWVKKAPSPSAAEWAAGVSELRRAKNVSTWQAICDALGIEVAGDSARRKLRNWVKANRPNWPSVPEIESDA